jgi:hypothetical protein
VVNCNLCWILQEVLIFFHYSCEHLWWQAET